MTTISLQAADLKKPSFDWVGGHLLSMMRNPLGFTYGNLAYGDIVPLNFVGTTSYQITNTELIAQILLNSELWQKSRFYKGTLREYLGEGLLISDGDIWRRQRKLVQPAFHTKRVQSYADGMVTDLNVLLASWSEGDVKDLSTELMQLTFTIVAKTLFGFDSLLDESQVVGQVMASALDFMLADIVANSQSLLPLPAWVPTPAHLQRKRTIKALNELILPIIDERRSSGKDRGDLLSMLLFSKDENGQTMTDIEVRNEALTLMMAAQETTATVLMWTFYLLSLYPEVLATLEFEIDSVLAGRLPTLSDIRFLPYAEQVIKEAMRLYPPVWMLSRQTSADTSLGGHFMPRGTNIMISLWALHRDSRIYANAELFKPSRWDSALASQVSRYAYLPFGGGPRVCIGNAFAMMEMILLLATIVQRFRLHHVEGHVIELYPVATLRSKRGMPMHLERR
jgi:cytochrome P450